MVLCYIAMEAVARLVGCFTYKTRRFWGLQTRSIYQSQRVTGSLGSDFGRRFSPKARTIWKVLIHPLMRDEPLSNHVQPV